MRHGSRRKGRAANDAAPAQDRWLISYADFVTLLLAVFIVLFAFAWKQKRPLENLSIAVHQGFDTLGANPDPAVVAPAVSLPSAVPAAPPEPRTEVVTKRLYDQLRPILGDSIDRREIVMQETPEGLVISLRELGFFASGGANLLPGAADKIKRAAEVLRDQGYEIRVEGHSDDQPIHSAIYHSNWELSIARAMSVLNILVEEAGFPQNRISAAGYGAFRPVAGNDTPEGRQQNRRVDLVIIAPAAPSRPQLQR